MQKKSVSLSGHRTSILLEAEFWAELNRFAAEDSTSLASLIGRVDFARTTSLAETETPANLASSLRVYVLNRLKKEMMV